MQAKLEYFSHLLLNYSIYLEPLFSNLVKRDTQNTAFATILRKPHALKFYDFLQNCETERLHCRSYIPINFEMYARKYRPFSIMIYKDLGHVC